MDSSPQPFREPNTVGSVKRIAQSEDDVLLEEMAFSPAFRVFINEIIAPLVLELREQLLRNPKLAPDARAEYVAKLEVTERIFQDLFARTASSSVPEALQNFFR